MNQYSMRYDSDMREYIEEAIRMLENQDKNLSIYEIRAVQVAVKILHQVAEDLSKSCDGCAREEFLDLLFTPLDDCRNCQRYSGISDNYEKK